ncbi:MAG: TonB family protein [Gammaproteobacteria bacterium]|nr:TonB family protein [Gammaproteobacteria bacterium]MDH5630635.1 TonB family protein [Gammaproteobacteria bacterium]
MKLWRYNFFYLLAILSLSTFVKSENKKSEIEKQFNQSYQAYRESLKDKKFDNAYLQAKESYKFGLKLYGEESINTARLATNYANLSVRLNKFDDDILQSISSAIKVIEDIEGYDSNNLIMAYYTKGLIYLKNNKNSNDANLMFDKAIAVSKQDKKKYAEILWEAASAHHSMKGLYSTKRWLKVISYYEKAAELFKQSSDSRYGMALFNIAKFYAMDSRHYKKAEEYFRDALIEFEKSEDKATQYQIHAFMVKLYSESYESDKATVHCLEAAKIKPNEENLQPDPLYFIWPKYPIHAAFVGKEGIVDIEFIIDKEGKVKSPKISDSKGPVIFQREALRVFKKWRFAPKLVNDVPVESKSRYSMVFKVEE